MRAEVTVNFAAAILKRDAEAAARIREWTGDDAVAQAEIEMWSILRELGFTETVRAWRAAEKAMVEKENL